MPAIISGGTGAWRSCGSLGRNPEAGEPDVAGVVDEHVRRLNVLMNKTTAVDLAECCRQADSDVQDAGQIERSSLVPLKNQIQGLASRIFEYKDCPPFVTSERQRLGCPRGIEFGCERVFVLEPPKTLRRRMFRGECDRQDRRWVAVLSAAVKGEVRGLPGGAPARTRKARSWRRTSSSPRLHDPRIHFDEKL